MTPELKQAWIDALRSGKYQQTTGWLHNDEGFCCLGVLCDVAQPTGWDGWKVHDLSSVVGYEAADEMGLPYSVHDDDVLDDDQLMAMNDDQRMTFAEIADEIERRLV